MFRVRQCCLALLLGRMHTCSKMPEKDAEFLTPATRLLEKKREMAEVEEALSATKEVEQSSTYVLLSCIPIFYSFNAPINIFNIQYSILYNICIQTERVESPSTEHAFLVKLRTNTPIVLSRGGGGRGG